MNTSKEVDIDGLYKDVQTELKRILELSPNADPNSILIKSMMAEDEEEQEANRILNKNSVKKKLCAALQTFTGDIWALSKIVTTVIATFWFSGSAMVNVNLPLIIAIIVIILFKRVGIEAYCAD